VTPIVRLHTAIAKLERLRAEAEGLGPHAGSLARPAEELIVTLHRTIDAQLAILRFAVKRLGAVQVLTGKHAEAHAHEMALVDAILGSDS